MISSIPVESQTIFIVDNSQLIPFTPNPTHTLNKAGLRHHTQLVVYMSDKPQVGIPTDKIEQMNILIRMEGEPIESATKERILVSSHQSKDHCSAGN